MTATVPTTPNAEIQSLLSFLDAQRRHVLGILDGLDAEALRRPVLPSGWSCLGLVQHLALDVERFWFRAVITGDPAVIAALDDIDDAWEVASDVSHTKVLARHRPEADLADTAHRTSRRRTRTHRRQTVDGADLKLAADSRRGRATCGTALTSSCAVGGETSRNSAALVMRPAVPGSGPRSAEGTTGRRRLARCR
ncbi:DUF664 domain-containing protein [Streptomyces parvulus]|uniref:mycothiol transferase n=1 Tax=Streptomyces parvulus TaxID=146923 RepID=UPI0037F352EB